MNNQRLENKLYSLEGLNTIRSKFLVGGVNELNFKYWGTGISTPSLAETTDLWCYSLPFTEPHFSSFHLKIQLDETTDQAARRKSEHTWFVQWLCDFGISFNGKHLIQPLCGPGHSANALFKADLQQYTGLDISPATVAYARCRFPKETSFAKFIQEDILQWNAPVGFSADIAFLAYEALNAFPETDGVALLKKLFHLLKPGGLLICEVRLSETVVTPTLKRTSIDYLDAGLFYAKPHIALDEYATTIDGRHIGHQFLIVPLSDARITAVFRSLLRLYSRQEIHKTLNEAGYHILFEDNPFTGRISDVNESQNNLVIIAQRS